MIMIWIFFFDKLIEEFDDFSIFASDMFEKTEVFEIEIDIFEKFENCEIFDVFFDSFFLTSKTFHVEKNEKIEMIRKTI